MAGEVCPSCLAGPGQGHDPDCNADRRPRENGVLVCKCEYSAMLKAQLKAAEAGLHRAWVDGMGVGYKAGQEPAWIPPECPYPKPDSQHPMSNFANHEPSALRMRGVVRDRYRGGETAHALALDYGCTTADIGYALSEKEE